MIDFHVHAPDIFSPRKLPPEEAAARLVSEMGRARVCRALLYAVEASVERLRRLVSPARLVRAVEGAISAGIVALPPHLMRLVEDPGAALEEHARLLGAAITPSERVIEISRRSGGRILPVACPDPSAGTDELLARAEALARAGAVAFKVLPTIQLLEGRDVAKLEALAELLQERGLPLIIHTGCDPGLWELPEFCEYGRPSRFERIARRFRDLTVVLAHTGAYSALVPGIYMHEALDMMRRYPNVYGDTAAVDPELVEYAARKVGPEKLLFGSDYPVVAGATWEELVGAALSLRLPERWVERIVRENAAELLGLEDAGG